jgi:hypothetical protein
MKADPRFLRLPKDFWAHVRSLSQQLGYSDKVQNVKTPGLTEILHGLAQIGLSSEHVAREKSPTALGKSLLDYFEHRARVLNEFVRPRLMDKERARKEFESLREKLNPKCPLPMNKQKGDKRAPAFLTGLVNMLIEAGVGGNKCDFNPGLLTTITRDGAPLRTLARRVDGAFPSSINPIAIWEIKEYYYTTTFGSRVADGVYETLLDGTELEELLEREKIDVKHYLMVDDLFTWWVKGKPYLCRIVDMLHMGYIDEALFGYEVVERLPEIVAGWIKILEK